MSKILSKFKTDRIGIIDEGKLISLGTLDDLRKGENSEALEEIFLKLFDKGNSDHEGHSQ